jgi:hypothetical protein
MDADNVSAEEPLSEADARRIRYLPLAARLWLRREKGIYGLIATGVYFAEHPEELEPFLTPAHDQAMKDEDEAWERFVLAGTRRQHFEAVAGAFYSYQDNRDHSEPRESYHATARAPRRQPRSSRTRSSRGSPSSGSASSDDDPDPDGLRVGVGTWQPSHVAEPPADVTQPAKAVTS